MNCIDKECKYRELNGSDGEGDFYYCKYVGIECGRGEEECFIDKFNKMRVL